MYTNEMKFCCGCRNACSIDDLSCPMGKVFLEKYKADQAREKEEKTGNVTKTVSKSEPAAFSNGILEGMKRKSDFYICPVCGNVTWSSSVSPIIRCCSRTVSAEIINMESAENLAQIKVEDGKYIIDFSNVDDEVSFVAAVSKDSVQLKKQPEKETAFLKEDETTIYYYCKNRGLFELKTY